MNVVLSLKAGGEREGEEREGEEREDGSYHMQYGEAIHITCFYMLLSPSLFNPSICIPLMVRITGYM